MTYHKHFTLIATGAIVGERATCGDRRSMHDCSGHSRSGPTTMHTRGRCAYPHSPTYLVDDLAVLTTAFAAQIVAPLETVDEVIGEDDLALHVKLMLGA